VEKRDKRTEGTTFIFQFSLRVGRCHKEKFKRNRNFLGGRL
jgi:hypothetical protein